MVSLTLAPLRALSERLVGIGLGVVGGCPEQTETNNMLAKTSTPRSRQKKTEFLRFPMDRAKSTLISILLYEIGHLEGGQPDFLFHPGKL
jgi:hypothetical protein